MKLYFKIQNKMLTKNLLYIIATIVIMFNIAIRIFPNKFIEMNSLFDDDYSIIKIIPKELFTYCDVYLLLIFIILIFFFLGIDFNNSMEEISLAIGGSKTNKLMLKKLTVILSIYLFLYSITFLNIYTLYNSLLPSKAQLLPLKEILFYSISTNIFIISISLLILFIFKDTAISVSIITAYYLIEEALWRCKVTQTYGILGHLYQYYDYQNGEIYIIKIYYILISLFALIITYKLSQKVNRRFSKKRSII